MNRQDILLGAKTECLRLFALSLPNLTKQSADKIFAMAYKTTNFAEHRLFLDGYAALVNSESLLRQHLEISLADLLNRSIQTAYSTQRPSAASTDAWLLVDSSIIDDEIRLHKITSLFHEESGTDIGNLNLRIASLFKQNTVKERENPFRPYIFSRCISTTVGRIGLPSDMALTLVEQLATDLVDVVAGIYRSLNIFFEKNGVAATLPALEKMRSNDDFSASGPSDEFARARNAAAPKSDASGKANSIINNAFGAAPAEPGGTPILKIEQLLRMVRKNAVTVHSPESSKLGSLTIRDEAPGEPLISDAGASTGWISGQQIVGDALQRFFAGRGSDAALKPVETGESVTLSLAAFSALSENSIYHFLKKTQPTRLEDVIGEHGEVRNLILEGRSSLAGRASNVDEMMTIDVVGMIFEFLLRDPHVPAEVRAQLGRLQFLLLKLALLDPQLLTQAHHPARKLINRIGTISLGLKPEDPFTARFTAEIHRIVEALLADESDSLVLISQLLVEFEAFVAQNFRFSNVNVERAVEAMEEAEKRSLYFARGSAKLKDIFSTVLTDPYLQGFIETTWLQAIEKAEHTDADLATRYRHLVPELVWSIQGKGSKSERASLLSHLPQMLVDLKAGLSSVKYAEKQTFLNWLVISHTRAIKATGGDHEYFSLSALRERFQSFIDNPASEETVDQVPVRFDRRFIHDAVEELEVQLDQIETVLEFGYDLNSKDAKHSETETPATSNCAGAEGVLNHLRVGVPVEINVDGAPRKAMLNWMNTDATNMILSVEGNNFPTTISVALFRRLLANSRARFIEVSPLFERAVTSLLETADKVDEIFE